MILSHRPLGDRMQRIHLLFDETLLERRVPERDGIEIPLYSYPVLGGRPDRTMPLRREPEFLQRLAIDLEEDGLGAAEKAEVLGPFGIVPIGMPVVFYVVGKLVEPVAAVLGISL